MKSEIAKAVQEQVFEFENLMADLQQQKTSVSGPLLIVYTMLQFARTKTQDDKRYAKQRMKELLPKQPRPAKQPWKESTNHQYAFEADIKRLPTNQLTNGQLYRVNLLPRSYDEHVDKELHTGGFRMAGKTANFFPHPGLELQTKEGKDRLARAEATFTTYVQKQKDEYDHFMNNKRQIFASRMKPRWAPTSNTGEQLQEMVSDPNNFYKKSLIPLDKQPLQEDAFKRTTTLGNQFKAETASII